MADRVGAPVVNGTDWPASNAVDGRPDDKSASVPA
jgi:hypothetical protein